MTAWPDERILNRLALKFPIVQAPMAGSDSVDLAVEVSEAGGLGSLACAMLDADKIRLEVSAFRARTSGPLNLNFFCHALPDSSDSIDRAWRERLAGYYTELEIDPADTVQGVRGVSRQPFNQVSCAVVEELRPDVVSFHFGLPSPNLLDRVRKTGCFILSSATCVAEAVWLKARGCHAIIAQGYEAGGHRASFLSHGVDSQVGTLSLVPQIADAVRLPVIAAGGIADGRGIAAALALGASAVQIGTAYLFCPEARVSSLYRQALRSSADDATVLTNVFTGRAARGIRNRFIEEVGPVSDLAPAFPHAAPSVTPLRRQSELQGSTGFMQMWAGQSASLGRVMGARELTLLLAQEAQSRMNRLRGNSQNDEHG